MEHSKDRTQNKQASGCSAHAENPAPAGVSVHRNGSRSLERAPNVRLYADGRVWVCSLRKFYRGRGSRNFIPGSLLGPTLRGAMACRLILEAWVGPEPFPGAHARHLNDDPRIDAIDNLAWGTGTDNRRDSSENFMRRRWGKRCPALVREARILLALGYSLPKLGRWEGVPWTRIKRLARDPLMFPGILTDPAKLAAAVAKRAAAEEVA